MVAVASAGQPMRGAAAVLVSYLEVHEVHQLGDLRLQHLHRLLVDLHPVGLLVTLHLKHQ